MKRAQAAILIAAASSVLLYGAFEFLTHHYSPYSKAELDWNDNGTISVDEYWRASDVGKRTVHVSNEPCDEYFNYKDGIEFKVVCSGTTINLNQAVQMRAPAARAETRE